MPEIKTPICDLLGIKVPIIQAPVGNATTPSLAAAVSNAGALGMLSLTWRSKASVREQIRETQAQTNNPFGINLVLEWPQEARVNLCLEAGVGFFLFSGVIPLCIWGY